jgi:exodeoxyribonuclease V alpha subunit
VTGSFLSWPPKGVPSELQAGGRLPAAIDRYLGSLLGPDVNEAGRTLVARLAQAVREGESCLLLGESAAIGHEGETRGAIGELIDSLVRSGSVVRAVGADLLEDRGQPFVVDEADRFYFRRHYRAECEVARHLVRLALPQTLGTRSANLERSLAAYFPPTASGNAPDLQRMAAEACLEMGVTLVTGGPGTGKTTTVVKILALIIEQGLELGRAPNICLLAPTGKAADRLLEAVRGALMRTPIPQEFARHLPTTSSTVHRALGAGYGVNSQFRRGSDSPILADCVVVDEVSMLDLALSVHLLEALRTGTRLILLGDPNQLASVDSGSVLSEMLSAVARLRSTQAVGGSVPIAAVELTRSYRFSSGGGLAELAGAVRAGDAEQATALAIGGLSAEVRWAELGANERFSRQRIEEFAARYEPMVHANSVEESLARINQFRVLCAFRQGPRGVSEYNALLGESLQGGRATGSYFQGQPLLILQNDPQMGLFNGDVGVVWRSASGQLAAHFSRTDQGIVRVPLGVLPEHEPAFAMTVHKSQGSEYDDVALVLPDIGHDQTLTRELLYTAITRARKCVSILGTKAVFRAGVGRLTVRAAGLSDRIVQLARRSSSTP